MGSYSFFSSIEWSIVVNQRVYISDWFASSNTLCLKICFLQLAHWAVKLLWLGFKFL
jgi:hypothetical protein